MKTWFSARLWKMRASDFLIIIKLKKTIQSELTAIQESLDTIVQDENDVNEFIRRLKKYAGFEELTREMALDLIEYITVDEYVPRSTEPRTIHIYYKFLDKPLKNKNNALK